mgnify:CR=1 FL=1|tara:strand:+ start:1363 stop:2025 length:663 start_codon:yes stop_codon:yes gene_type:complete
MNIFGFWFIFILDKTYAFTNKFCIVGSGSGLGRELVYQAVHNYNSSVIALSNNGMYPKIPVRKNSFSEIKNAPLFINNLIERDCYWNNIDDKLYENIIFTTSARPFNEDYSDKLLNKFLNNIPSSCKRLILISAYGVGDSLDNSNIGIKVMDKWYLKEVYRAKNEQEKILNSKDFKLKYPNIKTFIIRPKSLSYEKSMLLSQTRFELAQDILKFCYFDEY